MVYFYTTHSKWQPRAKLSLLFLENLKKMLNKWSNKSCVMMMYVSLSHLETIILLHFFYMRCRAHFTCGSAQAVWHRMATCHLSHQTTKVFHRKIFHFAIPLFLTRFIPIKCRCSILTVSLTWGQFNKF